MINHCPTPDCPSLNFRKYGTFYRHCDGKHVQRWTCTKCNLHFSSPTLHQSSPTFTSAYRQKKRRVNIHVYKLLSSGVSLRRTALLLKIHRTTVARKMAYLSRVSKERQRKRLDALPKVSEVQFADLITL